MSCQISFNIHRYNEKQKLTLKPGKLHRTWWDFME